MKKWLAAWQLIAAFILSATLCMGCSGPADSNASKENALGTPVDAGSTVPGNAGFSATIDGVAVTGKGVDDYNQQNIASILPIDNNRQEILFTLLSTKDGNDKKANYSLRFSYPVKTGTYQSPGPANMQDFGITLMSGLTTAPFGRYLSDTLAVTISTLTSSRVAGTFSGSLKLDNDAPNGPKKKIMITDGKFDIPILTAAK